MQESMSKDGHAFPIMEGSQLVGIVTLQDIRGASKDRGVLNEYVRSFSRRSLALSVCDLHQNTLCLHTDTPRWRGLVESGFEKRLLVPGARP
jgi:hypothetical protein